MSNRPPTAAVEPISDDRRIESLNQTMTAHTAGEPLRVFAYGSLLWDPCFQFDHRAPARLPGWVRRTCLWTVHARGSLEHPGLFYGLDTEPDGFCDGAVYTLSQGSLDQGLDQLWRREMHAAIYVPRWLTLETEQGQARALTFVVNRAHEQYAGALDLETAADYIAKAGGKFGSCAEYYTSTVAALRAQDLEDADLVALLRQVEQRSSW